MTNDVISFINSVGFPIAVSIALYYQNIQVNKLYNQMVEDFSKAVYENTKKLSVLIEQLRKDIK